MPRNQEVTTCSPRLLTLLPPSIAPDTRPKLPVLKKGHTILPLFPSINTPASQILFPDIPSVSDFFILSPQHHHLASPTSNRQQTATMATTVHVQNIGLKTEDKEIRDFFTFW